MGRTIDHGHRRRGVQSQTYNTWRGMLARCRNPNHYGFQYYGGKGVQVCERWKKFENFLADMGERPEGTTLDRIDGQLGYAKDNCRWATWREQRLNRAAANPIAVR